MLHEINSDLKTAEATLKHWEVKLPEIIRTEAYARVDAEVGWADAIKQIVDRVPPGEKQPTVAVMEAEATKICADKIKAKRLAEAEAEIAKRLINIAETTLTSIQSRLKLETIEAGLSGLRT